jgi:hypothetical protein
MFMLYISMECEIVFNYFDYIWVVTWNSKLSAFVSCRPEVSPNGRSVYPYRFLSVLSVSLLIITLINNRAVFISL